MYEKKIFRSNLKKVDYKEFNLSNKNQKFISKLIERKKICTYIPLDSELDINLFLNTFLEIQTTFLDDNELNVCLLKEPFPYRVVLQILKMPILVQKIFQYC